MWKPKLCLDDYLVMEHGRPKGKDLPDKEKEQFDHKRAYRESGSWREGVSWPGSGTQANEKSCVMLVSLTTYLVRK